MKSSIPTRVLIVDDEEPIRKFVANALRKAGYETVVASDGPEAIELAANPEPFDVLVTDLQMPLMDGAELAWRMRQRSPNIKVLFLSGHTDRLLDGKRALWESEAYLDKPCTPSQLREAVALLLNR